MKKIILFFKKLFGCDKVTTTTTTKKIVVGEPFEPNFDKFYPFNVNGVEEDISKICNSGVLTLYANCDKLSMGCYVVENIETRDFSNLGGKYFHDYMNDTVYYVQDIDGMIINVGSCNL